MQNLLNQTNPKLVFVVGVPRSGTTLTRVLLGSHNMVLALPETPWITGAYGNIVNLADLYTDLCEHKLGLLENTKHVKINDVQSSIDIFLKSTVKRAAERTGSSHVVLKTPDDSIRSNFLKSVFRDSYFVHVRRDPRDVVLSTMERYEAINNYGRATAHNCLQRWFDYEEKIQSELSDSPRYIRIEYENLACRPTETLTEICKHLCLDFDMNMLSYSKFPHELPQWEEGSYDIRKQSEILFSTRYQNVGKIPLNTRIAFNDGCEKIVSAGYDDFLYSLV